MTISIVLATYNGAQYIEEQLDSIAHQTLPPDELIICDDRSTDNTVEVVTNYINLHNLTDKWKIIVNETNLGYADNFDKVSNLATRDLIFFSDQDDTWRLDKISIMSEIMESHDDCQVLCTDYFPWYDSVDAPKAPKSTLKKMPDNNLLEKINLSKQSVYIGALGCCMCVRREFYSRISEYFFEGWAQDDRMWKMSQCADGCYILHSNLVNHRIHGHNTATYGKYHTIERRVKLFTDMLLADKQMLKYISTTTVSNKGATILRKHIEMMQLRIDLLSNKKYFNVLSLIKYIPYYEKKKSYAVDFLMAIRGQ